MSNFWTRALTGAVFVSVMMGCIWWNFWSMTGLFLMISILGLWEFYSLLKKVDFFPQVFIGLIIAPVIFFSATIISGIYLTLEWMIVRYLLVSYPFILAFLLLFGMFIIELFRGKNQPLINIGITILGIIYIVFPFAILLILSVDGSSFNPNILLGFFFLLWSNDTFAYLVGRAIGKTKLFERISPKKTWEGFIGGGICTQGIAYVLSIYFTELAPIHWHVVALIVSVFGTMGDLVESMFKRSLGVKNSGNILPGHGGILDRFDGVLLSSPFVVTYLIMIR